jgi:hypothetical protein
LVQPPIHKMEHFDSRSALRTPLSGSASAIEAECARIIGEAPDEKLVPVGKPEKQREERWIKTLCDEHDTSEHGKRYS